MQLEINGGGGSDPSANYVKSEVLDAANCSENKLVKFDVSILVNQVALLGFQLQQKHY